MAALLIDRRGVSLAYEGECLIIRHPQMPTRSVPMRRLDKIICQHSVEVETRLIGQCQRFGIDFIVLNQRYSEYSFAIHANHQRQAARRLAQYQVSSTPVLAYPLAQHLVLHKIGVSIACIRELADANVLDRLRQIRQEIRGAGDLDRLRGHEGVAQRLMFDFWRSHLPPGLGFSGRNRRPPRDPVNALFSLVFTLAQHEAIRKSLLHGLDPWLGIYHLPASGRHSLACDLIEPLRPRLERWTVDIFRDKKLGSQHFSISAAGCLLGKQGREIFYRLWQDKLPSISRRLDRHARVLVKVFHKIHDPDEVDNGKRLVFSEL